jgi:hypothetical protein
VGIPAKPLIDKASGRLWTSFQQSYPQKFWISFHFLLNQQLKASFKRMPEENASNQALA